MNTTARTLERPGARIALRAADYLTLMKPELTGLSVLTALFGTWLAQEGSFDLRPFLVVLSGTLFVGGGAGALNQYLERREDALMKRTERRPLPSGRVAPWEALLLGAVLSPAGIVLLVAGANLLTGAIAAVVSVSYLFLYTPLKKITPAATFIGGIPGALPPVIGWTAVRDGVGPEAALLFLVLFAWQMPHFYSLAWMYRRDYARAGYAMLTSRDESGLRTGNRMVAYSAGLLLLAPALYAAEMGGAWSSLAALALGAAMLLPAWRFRTLAGDAPSEERQQEMNRTARRLFFASLLYLPLLILAISAGAS